MTGQDEHDRESQAQDDAPKGSLLELYERMSKVMRDNLEKAGTLTEDAFERAWKESRDWAFRMREHYSGDIGKVADFVRRDWQEAIRMTREQTRKSLDMDRLQVGVLGALSRLAQSAGSQLETFASKLNERLTYKTGEIAGMGTLECGNCHQQLVLEKPTRIPPCPKCRGTVFRRSY